MRQYIALIHKDPDSDYGVSFPDLPGCVTAGLDLDDARAMAEEALCLHLDGMAEDGEPIPEPSSLEAVMADRENRDAVAILVNAPPATAKAVRVNMTLPEDELARIDKFAVEHGMTRSGFLLHAAKKALRRGGGGALSSARDGARRAQPCADRARSRSTRRASRRRQNRWRREARARAPLRFAVAPTPMKKDCSRTIGHSSMALANGPGVPAEPRDEGA